MNGTWSRVDIGGKSADVYELPGTARPRFGVLHLHGEDQRTLADQPVFTRLFDELHLVCICPHGRLSWWVDRPCLEFDPQQTPERYLLQSIVPFFRARWDLHPRSIGLHGIGMGGQGALRLAFKRPDLFPVVAAITPSIEYHELYGHGTSLDEMYDSKEQCRQDTVPMHVHPSQYPPHLLFCCPPDVFWYRGCDRLHEKLNALGVPHEFDATPLPGGLTWDYFQRMAEPTIRFLHRGLEQESRRLL
jgi:hypothetical protein